MDNFAYWLLIATVIFAWISDCVIWFNWTEEIWEQFIHFLVRIDFFGCFFFVFFWFCLVMVLEKLKLPWQSVLKIPELFITSEQPAENGRDRERKKHTTNLKTVFDLNWSWRGFVGQKYGERRRAFYVESFF